MKNFSIKVETLSGRDLYHCFWFFLIDFDFDGDFDEKKKSKGKKKNKSSGFQAFGR